MRRGRGSGWASVVLGVAAATALAAPAAGQAPDAQPRSPGADAGAAPGSPGVGATAEDRPRFVPGELIVRFKPSAPAARKDALREAADAELEERLPLPGVQQLDLDRGTAVREAAGELESRAGVAYAEPNFYRYPQAIPPDDEHFGLLWGLHNEGQPVKQSSANQAGTSGSADADIDALEAWQLDEGGATGSSDVTVAVVDTGVSYGHPDLSPNIWENPEPATNASPGDGACAPVEDHRGWDFVDCDNDPSDELDGHGTHVAGTIGAAGDDGLGVTGVNWDVSIMPLRVLGPNGGTTSDVVAAFDYARDHGADVVNASFGGEGVSAAEEQAVRSAPNVLFVTAAGNDGADNDQTPWGPCSVTAPNLVCAAATDQNDTLAGFSNTGRRSVDLAAPGVNTLSTRAQAFFEDFETSIEGRWTTGGVDDTWGRTSELSVEGDGNTLADSPLGDYANGTDSSARSPGIDLTGRRDCRLNYHLQRDLEAPESDTDDSFDYLAVEASTDGTNWQSLFKDPDGNDLVYTGSFTGPESNDLSAFDGSRSLRVRYRLVTDEANTADGVHIDDVAIACGSHYEYRSGTSMATPHVAGVAALALARASARGWNPSVLDLRAALLDGGDPLPSLQGKTVTGRRLNALGALELVGTSPAVPTTTIAGNPATRTRSRAANFGFMADNPDVEFRCQVDDRGWVPCESPFRVSALGDGFHNFRVSARRPGGSWGPFDRHDFLVDGTGPVMGVSGSTVKMGRGGTARVRLTCPGAELSGPCRGELRLKTAQRVKVGAKRKKLALGTGAFTIDRGQTSRVPVALTRNGRALLDRERSVTAAGRATAADALGNTGTGSGRFTLRVR